MRPRHTPPPFGTVEAIDDRSALLRDINDYYGIAPGSFDRFRFWVNTTSGSIWMSSAETDRIGDLPLASVGVLALRAREPVGRLSNGVIRLIGADASRNVVRVDDAGARAFMSRTPIPMADADQRGYRIVNWKGEPLGRGIIREGRLFSELPKSLKVPLDAWTY